MYKTILRSSCVPEGYCIRFIKKEDMEDYYFFERYYDNTYHPIVFRDVMDLKTAEIQYVLFCKRYIKKTKKYV